MNWIDEMFDGEGISKKAADETNQQKEFDKKLATQDWVKDIMSIDEAALAKEEESAFMAEEIARGLNPEAEVKKEAAYEKGDTCEDTIEKDYELRVKSLSDYNLAEMLAEYECLKVNAATVNTNEYKEEELKKAQSDRSASEKRLLKFLGDHTLIDWKKSFKELEKSEVKQATEKDLYAEWKTGKMAWEEKTKFEATTEKEKVEQMEGVGKEEEKGQVGKEAAKKPVCPKCGSSDSVTPAHDNKLNKCDACHYAFDAESAKNASQKTAATPSEIVEKKVEKLIKEKIDEAFAEAPAETPADFPKDPLMVGEGTPEDKLLDEMKVPHLEPGETPETEIKEWKGEEKPEVAPEEKKEEPKDEPKEDLKEDKKDAKEASQKTADSLMDELIQDQPRMPKFLKQKPDEEKEATSTVQSGYNGWSNYETWNVALWFDNDEGLYHHKLEFLKSGPKDADSIAEFVMDTMPNGTPDFNGKASRYMKVNWDEIAEAWKEDAPSNAPEEPLDLGPMESSIQPQASKKEVLEKIAEIASPWKVIKNEKGEELIARVEPIKTEKVSKDKDKNDITNDVK